MRKLIFWTFYIPFLLIPRVAAAFQNGQHKKITQVAVGQITSTQYPDIVRFGPLMTSWSWGVGGPENQSGTFNQAISQWANLGKPAEELAHVQDQTLLMDKTAALDGGDYEAISNVNPLAPGEILAAYRLGNFSDETAHSEGAYVWAGAAIHLIEDQASPPHAADILHGLGDQFEGPLNQAGAKIDNFVFRSDEGKRSTNLTFYKDCLIQTQSLLPSYQSPVGIPPNQQLYQTWLLC